MELRQMSFQTIISMLEGQSCEHNEAILKLIVKLNWFPWWEADCSYIKTEIIY